MRCEDAIRQVSASVGSDEMPGALAAHLRGCAGCRRAHEAQREVCSVLAAWPDSPPSDRFALRLAMRLDEEDRRAGWLSAVDWRRWSLGLMPAAAALLWLAVAGPLAPRADTAGETAAALIGWGLQEGVPDTDVDPGLSLLGPAGGGRR